MQVDRKLFRVMVVSGRNRPAWVKMTVEVVPSVRSRLAVLICRHEGATAGGTQGELKAGGTGGLAQAKTESTKPKEPPESACT